MEKTPFTLYLHDLYQESGSNQKVNQTEVAFQAQKLLFLTAGRGGSRDSHLHQLGT